MLTITTSLSHLIVQFPSFYTLISAEDLNDHNEAIRKTVDWWKHYQRTLFRRYFEDFSQLETNTIRSETELQQQLFQLSRKKLHSSPTYTNKYMLHQWECQETICSSCSNEKFFGRILHLDPSTTIESLRKVQHWMCWRNEYPYHI